MQDTGTVEAADRPRGGPQTEGRKEAGLETSEVLVNCSFQFEDQVCRKH